MTNKLTAAGGSAGRFIPEKAELVHEAFGRILISNYNENISYSISVNSGNATISGDLITLSSENAICTVTPVSLKGGIALDSTFERKKYTYTTRTSTSSGTCCSTSYRCTGCYCCPAGSGRCSCSNPSWGQCGCTNYYMCWTGCGNYQDCYTCTSTTTYLEKDSYSSSSFVDRFGEWAKSS